MEIREIVVPEINSSVDLPQVAVTASAADHIGHWRSSDRAASLQSNGYGA